MEIMEIVKDSLMFPVNNIKALAIYIVIIFVISILITGGLIASVASANSGAYLIITMILFVIAILIGFILSGYEVSIIKSGIAQVAEAPNLEWKENLMTGIKYVIVSIVYYIIPAIITLIVAFITNVPGNFVNVVQHINQTAMNANGTAVASTVTQMVPQDVLASLAGSLTITGLVALVLFIIFSFIQYMANARLAKTDSLGEALNIPVAFKDLSRIGYGKVIATVILMFIISLVISGILSFITQHIPQLSILSIIVTPFLMFALNRANGLLYSDIA